MRRLDTKAWVRLAAVAVLAAVVVASVIAVSHQPRSTASAAAASGDAVTAELDRCRALGTDAGKDPACQAAWRRLREHFFGQDGKEHRP